MDLSTLSLFTSTSVLSCELKCASETDTNRERETERQTDTTVKRDENMKAVIGENDREKAGNKERMRKRF